MVVENTIHLNHAQPVLEISIPDPVLVVLGSIFIPLALVLAFAIFTNNPVCPCALVPVLIFCTTVAPL